MLVLDTMAVHVIPEGHVASLLGSTLLAIAGLWVAWCGWNARLAIGGLNAIIGVIAGLAVIPTGVVCLVMRIWLRGPDRLHGVCDALFIFGVLLMSLILWLLIATKTKQAPVSRQHVA